MNIFKRRTLKSKIINHQMMKVFLLAPIGIGLVGAIFFFPLKLDGSHTCICDKMICEKETCCQEGFSILNGQNNKIMQLGINNNSHMYHAELLNEYLFPFAFLWWGSLIMVFSGFYLMKKYKSRFDNKKSVFQD